MEMRNGRTIERGQKVKVYVNLHRGCYSIADAKTGLVLGYADSLTLQDVTFKVNEKGRERVRKNRKKEVHAYVVGTFIQADNERPSVLETPVYYNPYKVDTFVVAESQEPIHKTLFAHLQDKKVFVA